MDEKISLNGALFCESANSNSNHNSNHNSNSNRNKKSWHGARRRRKGGEHLWSAW